MGERERDLESIWVRHKSLRNTLLRHCARAHLKGKRVRKETYNVPKETYYVPNETYTFTYLR
jgi:hypothetical protein